MLEKNLQPEQWFYSMDGKILKNIHELKDVFNNASKHYDYAYDFHSNNNNNDYANWIENVFLIPGLAQKLRKTINPEQALKLLEEELKSNPNPVQVNTELKQKEIVVESEKSLFQQSSNNDELKSSIEKFSQSSEQKLDKINLMKKKITYREEKSSFVEELEDLYDQAYHAIADSRKNGKDVFIASLKMRNIKPKISYYNITGNPEDYQKIKGLINDVFDEIMDANNYHPRDFKDEVLKGAEKIIDANSVSE